MDSAVRRVVGHGGGGAERGSAGYRLHHDLRGRAWVALVHGFLRRPLAHVIRGSSRNTGVDDPAQSGFSPSSSIAQPLTNCGKVDRLGVYMGMSGFDRGSGARTASRGASGCLVKQLATA